MLPLTLLVSCNVYTDALLDGDAGGEAGDFGGGAVLTDAGKGGGSPALANNGGGGKSSTPVQPNPEAGSPAAAGTVGSGGAGGSPAAGHGGSSAGAAGGAGGGSPPLPAGVDVLDDMEDGNFYLSPKPPRYGFWYLAGDATVGGQLPKIEELMSSPTPAREGSTLAVHFTASGFKGWGSSLGLSFTDVASKRVTYDAGDALGFSFWVRGTTEQGTKLRVQVPVLGSDPTGQECGGEGQGQCLDHFATQISVTTDWQHVTIPFSSLHQGGWGAPLGAFNPAEILGIEWSTGTMAVDLWLDDLALIRPE